jgi:hypothetical protein
MDPYTHSPIRLHPLDSKDGLDAVEPGALSRYRDGLGTGRPGFDSRPGQDFSLHHSVQIAFQGLTQLPIQ